MLKNMANSRRTFLKQAAAVSLGFRGLETLFQRTAYAGVQATEIPAGYGALRHTRPKSRAVTGCESRRGLWQQARAVGAIEYRLSL